MKRIAGVVGSVAVLAALTVGTVMADPGSAQPAPTEVVDVYADLDVSSDHDGHGSIVAASSTSDGAAEALPDVDPQPATADRAASGVGCDQTITTEYLNASFDHGVDSIAGADYQRAFELPDGRVLWVFQDAFVDDGVGDPTLVHNAGLLQDGACFNALHSGSLESPRSWVGADGTTALQHWYWPLDGFVADDETFVLFLAEMDEVGATYLENATPVATWSVEIDLVSMSVGPLERSPNPDERLYGFEVTTDEEFVYLYAQCHRQFGFGMLGHDECAADVFIARQPLDQPRSHPLEYWTDDGWTRNSNGAINVAPTTGPDGVERTVNPMQIERDGDRWIAVTLVGDWWGDQIYYDVAPRPEGPWTTTAVEPLPDNGDVDIASYFVSFVPSDDPDYTLAVSNNRWDGEFSAHYRPQFVAAPSELWEE
ncbi:MAG: hypothetical protein AAFY28_20055 [Actinomycetota bacterium]